MTKYMSFERKKKMTLDDSKQATTQHKTRNKQKVRDPKLDRLKTEPKIKGTDN